MSLGPANAAPLRRARRGRRHALIAALAAAALLACVGVRDAAAQTRALDQDAFAVAVVDAFGKEAPELSAQLAGPLTLMVSDGESAPMRMSLENAFQEYRANPRQFGRVLKRFVAGARAVATAPEFSEADRTALAPVIKPLGWIDGAEAAAAATPLVYETLTTDLVVVYGVDRGGLIAYLREDDLARIGLAREDLRGQAVANLSTLVTAFEIFRVDPYHGVTAGGLYETSLLLVDEFWDHGPLEVEGEIVVAAPGRGFLYIGGSANPEHVRGLRALAERIAAEQPYPLSQNLFVRRDGRFEVF